MKLKNPQGQPAASGFSLYHINVEGLFLTIGCQSVSSYQSFQTCRTVIDQSVNHVIGAPAGLLKA